MLLLHLQKQVKFLASKGSLFPRLKIAIIAIIKRIHLQKTAQSESYPLLTVSRSRIQDIFCSK